MAAIAPLPGCPSGLLPITLWFRFAANGLAGQVEEDRPFVRLQFGEDFVLQGCDHWPDAIQEPGSGFGQAQYAGAAVLWVDLAGDKALLLQPVDHPADRGAVIGDLGGDPGLVDPGKGGDRLHRGELHRRQVQPVSLHMAGEDLGGNLVEPPNQMSGHRVDAHANLPV